MTTKIDTNLEEKEISHLDSVILDDDNQTSLQVKKSKEPKTNLKQLELRRIQYQEDQTKKVKLHQMMEQQFQHIPETDLIHLKKNRIIKSKNKYFKLTYKVEKL